MARLRTGSLAAVALGFAGCSGVLALTSMTSDPLRPLVVGGLFAGAFALAAVTSFLYEKTES